MSVPCVMNYYVSYEYLNVFRRSRNQSIILQEEERSETLEEVQVLKINSSQEDLATYVEGACKSSRGDLLEED